MAQDKHKNMRFFKALIETAQRNEREANTRPGGIDRSAGTPPGGYVNPRQTYASWVPGDSWGPDGDATLDPSSPAPYSEPSSPSTSGRRGQEYSPPARRGRAREDRANPGVQAEGEAGGDIVRRPLPIRPQREAERILARPDLQNTGREMFNYFQLPAAPTAPVASIADQMGSGNLRAEALRGFNAGRGDSNQANRNVATAQTQPTGGRF